MAGKPGCGGKKGRSGRRPKRIEDKITLVEGYTLDKCLKIFEKGDDRQQFLLAKDLAGKVLGRRVQVSGDENGGPIRLVIRSASDKTEQKAG